jgi:cytochrome c-type biogenesis protein CcmH/NrfG
VLAALALPFLAILPFIHPGQGLFRDWDDFGATGVAVALVAAWLVGRTLEASPRGASLAFGVMLACAAPTLQWLAHHEDLDRGLARVRRFVTEPPERAAFERAVTWQFLGQAESDRGRFIPAADACAAAYTLLPSPNVSRQWGMAELRAARLDRAAHVFRGMVERDSNDVVAWTGLALAIADREDAAEVRRVSEHAARLDPDRRVLDAMMRALGPAIPMRSR